MVKKVGKHWSRMCVY